MSTHRNINRQITHLFAALAMVSPSVVEAADGAPQRDAPRTRQVPASESGRDIHLLHGSGLHHVNVRAFDMDKTIAFYEQAFGFRLLFRWDGVDAMREGQVYFRNPLRGAHLDMGDGQILELIPAPDAAIRPDDRASSFNHIGLRVSNLEETYVRALAAGAKPHPIQDGSGGVWDGPTTIRLKARPPFQRSFVVRAAHVEGPNGEIIELFES
ncbi:catechol 2,3-dioxygenase-like lactoylglutathione lyase family enzyme [Sphingomonas zeicaulis]|uniref:VOC family protein n=1 Tax=Sphingomonas zeicaulis TaxID=1632740 RepID=UPI003D263D20